VGLSCLQSNMRTGWDVLMAGTTIAIVPLIVIFLCFQRFFISGVMTSGMGGR